MKKNNDKHRDPYKRSPIPPHLTQEEREVWIEELEWEENERQRRKRGGKYRPQKPKKKTKGWSACQTWEMKR